MPPFPFILRLAGSLTRQTKETTRGMSTSPADTREPTGYMRRLSDARDRLIDRVVEDAAEYDTGHFQVDIETYLRSYFGNVAAEDLRERKPYDLAGQALSHLDFARRRERGTPKVRIFNPLASEDGWESTHTVVQMVNDDMPFLVDSLAMVLNRQGLTIHLTVHPVLHVRRDESHEIVDVSGSGDSHAESFIHVEVDRETDEQILESVRDLIENSMHDVRAATQDWRAMRMRLIEIADLTRATPPPLPAAVIDESLAMMRWMAEDNFTFLGYREYELVREGSEDVLQSIPDTGLGILRGGHSSRPKRADAKLRRAVRRMARSKDLLIITKANSQSTVHRPAYLDYVGVKTYDEDGGVTGELRFLGLFTSVAYSRSPRDIPLLRHKVQQVLDRSRLEPGSHAGKALMHILENFPRDELFQSNIEDLSRISRGILSLQERQRVKLFVRRDAFRRFVSCMVYVPRDKYNTQIRQRIQELLQAGLGGVSVESTVFLSESTLARLHVIVRTPPGSAPQHEVRSIERQIVEAVRTWEDRLRDVAVSRFGEADGLRRYRKYVGVFPAAYREDVSPRAASYDIESIAGLEQAPDALRMSLYRPRSEARNHLQIKLFCRDQPIPLSDALPMLENMGLRIISERPYELDTADGVVWMQDFETVFYRETAIDPRKVTQIFHEAFAETWRGHAENDGFNHLVLLERLTCRQVALLRAICKFLLQTGLPFSQTYIEEIMCRYSGVARLLVTAFESRFDPNCGERTRQRRRLATAQALDDQLDHVETLDGDRILRAFLGVVRNTLRTNFFQEHDGAPKGYISFKLDSRKLPDLPLPRPRFEIFVYAPWVEGVHLRGGRIARGGLRWSDRREDFRTEILGLMKAQTVKNTLIVPTGAKGGFVLKPEPDNEAPERLRERVHRAYTDFLRGLLDITDNLVGGELVPPDKVLRYDEDDPYLVVAADKGTATFSDTANAIAASYDFWMGDAFASGGSAGYDHKGMGITAKGAWEAVKRHFREIGIDVQKDPFTVTGIGDMSGDVFGNGMLLSPCIRLTAAFNHMHIFLDPDPDPEAGLRERRRLFGLPRSTWKDYDQDLISAGGGIWSRTDKYIDLSPQAQSMLDIDESRLTPQQLIQAILRAPVDLLWNGGIGTYVKASTETQSQAGDRANDAVRVDGAELRCKIVGEGGNLGLTQLGRIEFALKGGRVNTDFIDNSAGVDCSDHEVNIKILLNMAMQNGQLAADKRDALLADMTDEVEALVLRNNYLQTQAISIAESTAAVRLAEHAHLLRGLERRNELDRDLEHLPDEETIRERRKASLGLTRPELSVLLSYAKISLYAQLARSDIASDPYLSQELARYFPQPLQERFAGIMDDHRLHNEIIATQVTNTIVNRMGPAFANRMLEESGVGAGHLARTFTVARESLATREIWTDIELLDNQIPASAQYSMMIQTARLLRRATKWLLEHEPDSLDIAAAVAKFKPGMAMLDTKLPQLLVGKELRAYEESVVAYTDLGLPERLARRMAGLPSTYPGFDIIQVAHADGAEVDRVAAVYYRLGAGLKLDWLREQIEHLGVDGRWQAMARNTLRDNLYELNRTLAAEIIAGESKQAPAEAVGAWLESHVDRIRRTQNTLEDMRVAGPLDFATLSVALQEIRKLTHAV